MWKLSTILGSVVLLGAAIAVAKDDLRFWGWRSDTVKIAQVSYESRLRQEKAERRAINREIEECIEEADCPVQYHVRLTKDLDEVEDEIERLELEQAEIN